MIQLALTVAAVIFLGAIAIQIIGFIIDIFDL